MGVWRKGADMKPASRISIQQTQRLKLTTGLHTALRMLRSDAQGLTRYLEEQAAENPQLVLTRPQPQDWLPRWRSAFARPAGEDAGPEIAAAGASLQTHAFGVMSRLRLAPTEARIAVALVEALEPSGWLGRALPWIAAQTGTRPAEVEAVLIRLQAEADPPGLFARTLAECLRLQAQEAGELDAAMSAVLDRLDLVARGDAERLVHLLLELGQGAREGSHSKAAAILQL